jgi:hypothetical protein
VKQPIGLISFVCSLLPAIAQGHDVAAYMARAAEAFVSSLSVEQRTQVLLPFADVERENWHYIPRARRGLPFKQMTPEQRELARGLLASALSERGRATVENITSLETILAAIEHNPQRRDPENYFFSVFGTPGPEQPWGWRCEGHHISINLTIAGDNIVYTTPQFFGANPAEVRSGPRTGFRALAAEEDLGRAFVRSLTPEQRKAAVISETAPGEIINVPGREESKPMGVAWNDLDVAQRDALKKLLQLYLERFRPELATDAMQRVEKLGLGQLHFAWAGGLEPHEPHYYRIQADWFVLEYDCTQDGANHIHTVWREFGRDFGRDVLAEHYRAAH